MIRGGDEIEVLGHSSQGTKYTASTDMSKTKHDNITLIKHKETSEYTTITHEQNTSESLTYDQKREDVIEEYALTAKPYRHRVHKPDDSFNTGIEAMKLGALTGAIFGGLWFAGAAGAAGAAGYNMGGFEGSFIGLIVGGIIGAVSIGAAMGLGCYYSCRTTTETTVGENVEIPTNPIKNNNTKQHLKELRNRSAKTLKNLGWNILQGASNATRTVGESVARFFGRYKPIYHRIPTQDDL